MTPLEELRVATQAAREMQQIPTLEAIDRAIAHHRATFLWCGPRARFIAKQIDQLLDLRAICASWWADGA